MSIRSVRLRDYDGHVHTVPFSEVTTVRNMTKDFSFAVFDIGVAYRENVDEVIQIMVEVGEGMRGDPELGALHHGAARNRRARQVRRFGGRHPRALQGAAGPAMAHRPRIQPPPQGRVRQARHRDSVSRSRRSGSASTRPAKRRPCASRSRAARTRGRAWRTRPPRATAARSASRADRVRRVAPAQIHLNLRNSTRRSTASATKPATTAQKPHSACSPGMPPTFMPKKLAMTLSGSMIAATTEKM